MPGLSDSPPVAMLWQLAMNGDDLSCAVYRAGDRFELRLESSSTVILAEPFELLPRMMARTQALRASLKRRGWRDQ